MTRILAIDTTGSFGSLALLQDRDLLEEMPIHSPEGFSQVLFRRLEQFLGRHDVAVDQIDCFAAAAGPGSFTGVRVGLTAVKGLAEAAGRPAVAVSNLQALAACGTALVRAAVMDARRGEVYGAVYDADLRVLQPEVVMPFRDWMNALPAEVGEVISPDFAPFRSGFDRDVPIVERRSLAAAIARIAAMRLAAGLAVDPAGLDANYVRRSDAELFWREK